MRCSAVDKQSEPLRCRPQVDAAGGACPRRLFLAFTFLFFFAYIALHSSHFLHRRILALASKPKPRRPCAMLAIGAT